MPDYSRFRVRLLDTAADLWRSFLLRKNATFQDLHLAIQDACGWGDCHLFAFRAPDSRRTIAEADDEDGNPELAAAEIRLGDYFDLAGGLDSCTYLYDFGDDWRHEVKLEGVETHQERFMRRLMGGGGTFPPENCGSTWGYERCVAAVTGKKWLREYGSAKERAELVVWLKGWHPDSFDLAKVKKGFDH